ncbi:unnamed protein product, partial [Closterium sp. NIES-64]
MSNDGNTQISPSFIPSPPVIPPPLARPTRWQCLAFPLASSPGDDGNTHIFTFLIPLPPVTLRCPPSPAVAPRHPPLPPVTLRCSSSPCPRLLPLLDGSTRHGGSVPHPSLAFLFFASLFLRSPSFLPLSHCQVGVFEMAAQGMVAVPNPSLTFLLFTQKSLIPNHHPLYPYSQVGVFEMAAQGMVAVPNPSLAFLPASRTRGSAAVAVVMHGSRPLLLEVQALCVKAIPNIPPTKTANGVDMYRLTILTKIMRHIGLPIGSKDVVVNVVGGMQVKEPAADLAIAVAIASSLYESPVPADTAFIGEIGLNGELRG